MKVRINGESVFTNGKQMGKKCLAFYVFRFEIKINHKWNECVMASEPVKRINRIKCVSFEV